MTKFLKTFWADESGISSVEYAILLALIAVAIAVAASQLGQAVATKLHTACTIVNSDTAGNPGACP